MMSLCTPNVTGVLSEEEIQGGMRRNTSMYGTGLVAHALSSLLDQSGQYGDLIRNLPRQLNQCLHLSSISNSCYPDQ